MANLKNGTLNYFLTKDLDALENRENALKEMNKMDPTYPDPNDPRFTDPAPVFTILDNQLCRDGVTIGTLYNNKTGKIVEIDTITEDSFSYKDTNETAIITLDISVTTVSKLTGLKNVLVHDYSEDYLTFVAKESGTFTFTPQSNNVISYSTDSGDTWVQGNSVIVNNGDKVMWKGTMTPASTQGSGTFSSTGNFDIQGNAMSLLFGENFKGQTDLTGKDWAFYNLFSGNTKVVNAENLSLPATTLANYCYYGMFNGCTSLVSAPELPATTLVNECYGYMFNDCTSLTTAPKLPATTLANNCYATMFQGCASLTTAPELPATTLANYCYRDMFNGCTSLTTAPELLATTLATRCYFNMFSRCTSLTEAPELPATTLTNHCYDYMFQNCTNLNYIKAMFTTTPSTTYTWNWVSGVSATGTFVKNSAATWDVTGSDGIPTGWTVETE